MERSWKAVTIPSQKSKPKPSVEFSSEAIDLRFRELSQLYELGIAIRGARWLGTLCEIEEREGGDKERHHPLDSTRPSRKTGPVF